MTLSLGILWIVSIALAGLNTYAESIDDEAPIPISKLNISEINFPVGDWSPGLKTWIAPADMAKELPYYIMGYDYDNRPEALAASLLEVVTVVFSSRSILSIIVLEFGKWDGRKWVEKGGETYKNYDKHWEKFWYTVFTERSPFPEAEDGVVLIVDFKGFSARQLASAEAMKNYLVQARRSEYVQDQVADFIMVNMNFVAQTWMSLIGSVAGKLVGRAELYGSQPEKYLARLKEKIPRDQRPPWYGGSQNFKPITVFG